ncbi:MAG: 2Fe-2S iron-sulfur cluster-binding protein [Thermomicrobiales bacterium]
MALQCGYCTPGMIMAASAFLETDPIRPKKRFGTRSRETSAAAPYQNIVKAIQYAAKKG